MNGKMRDTAKAWLSGISAVAVLFSMVSSFDAPAVQAAEAAPESDGITQVKQLESDAWKARLFQFDDKILIGNSVVEIPASDNGAAAIHVGDPIYLGGFSGLTHLPGDPANVFYTHTDRGPNGDIDKKYCVGCKTFAVPTFSPQIVKISLENGSVKVLEQIPLKLPNGAIDPITGTSNISGVSNFPKEDKSDKSLVGSGVGDEVPVGSITYNEDGSVKEYTTLPSDPYGLDLESISYDQTTDTFWMSDEYRPNLVQVKRDGTILQRLVPNGEKALYEAVNATAVPINDVLPAVWSTRMPNRGIEGATLTPDGHYLFAAIQSPMINPITTDGKVNANSRASRIIKLDLTKTTPEPVAEYLYVLDGVKGVSNYISDMMAIDENHIVVDERDANYDYKKIFTIDLSNATDFLGKLDNIGAVGSAAGTTLENTVVQGASPDYAVAEPPYAVTPAGGTAVSVTPVTKSLTLDPRGEFAYPASKLEGLFMPNEHTVVVANDNDFGVQDPDKKQVWMYTLNVPAETANTAISAAPAVTAQVNGLVGSAKYINITAKLGEAAVLGTVTIELPQDLAAATSDMVKFGSGQARMLRDSEVKENGNYIVLDGVTLQAGESITVSLTGKTFKGNVIKPQVYVDSDGPEAGKSLNVASPSTNDLLLNEAWQARLFQFDDQILIGKSVVEIPASDNGAAAIHVGDPMYLGGFSGLTHLPGDPANVFYTHTDRGPNGDIDKKYCVGCKTFAVPTFSPQIVKISLENGSVKVLEQIPLKLPNGAIDPITGTSNISGVSNFPKTDKSDKSLVGSGVGDEVPVGSITYNEDGSVKEYTTLPSDPYGLDLESISYDQTTDTFWMSDEYRPNLVQVKRDGTILQRLVPNGEKALYEAAKATAVPINDVLPAVWSTRMPNRGIEGATLTPDGHYLFAAIQSPMINPITTDGKVNANSRASRIIKLDLTKTTPEPVAEYLYVLDGVNGVSNYISDMMAIDENHIVVDERDANYDYKQIYTINLSNATDFLGKLDNIGAVGSAAGTTLENTVVQGAKPEYKVAEPPYTVTPDGGTAVSVTPVTKMLTLDAQGEYAYPNSKLEGLFMPNDHTVVVANDNDFGVQDPDKKQVWAYSLYVPAVNSSTASSVAGTIQESVMNQTSSAEDIQLTVRLGESAMLGTMLVKLPAGLTAAATDLVSFNGSTPRALRSNELKEGGSYIVLDGLTLSAGQSVIVTLKGQDKSSDTTTLPSIWVDADGPENGKSLSQLFQRYSNPSNPNTDTPVTTPDSGTGLKADQTGKVDEAKLKEALAANQAVELALASDVANLPAATLAAGIQSGKTIHFVAEAGEYTLPLNVLNLDQLAQSLGVNKDELVIRITVAAAGTSAANAVSAAASSQGATVLGSPVEFRVEAVSKSGQSVPVSFGGTYVTRSIPVNGIVDPSRATGVMLDEATNELKFVPTVFETKDGLTTAVMKRNGNSVYAVVQSDKSFNDIASYWAKSDITLLANKLVIEGTINGKFEPNRNISRAEFAALIVRALGLTPEQSQQSFSDVSSGAWYANEVGAAVNAGIINGYNDNAFHPNAPITREEMAVILVRALNFTKVDLSVAASEQTSIIGSFKDAAKVGWSKPEVAAAVKAGLLNGYANQTLVPQGNATRGESAALIKRMLVKAGFINE
ncbi:esterase-like activity of phytase family protein [Paenibacillus glycanilyticus]|uniref:SLH domain-containing protein n=1 Tax=Paenibacillus glycanilyticus TaxID=126569 RepID=A0ABQ6GDK4_9BACL|nr:esterase-like activity of phytase family protein [Paenibacillus glycanilyticus]GLX68712.1 hypothetical protein MU1_30570 [Paenibacillus glycanilyticus]